MKHILLFFFVLGLISCDSTVQQGNPEDFQAKLDSLSGKRLEKFSSKYASAGEGFYPKDVDFEISKEKLSVHSGQSTIIYDLYDDGTKGATSYDMWYSDNYVRIINITVNRDVNKKIQSVQLNNHVFTNAPYIREEPKVEKTNPKKGKKIYVVKAGDTASSLSKQLNIPISKFPNPLPVGTKIVY